MVKKRDFLRNFENRFWSQAKIRAIKWAKTFCKTFKALVRSKNLTAHALALSQKICAQFLQDLALTLALKTF